MKIKRIVYAESLKVEVKHLFVDKEMRVKDIAKYYDNHPCKMTIERWSRKKDQHGKTWIQYRRERAEQKYLEMSPRSMANKILEKLWALLNDPDVDAGKLPDALWKLQKGLEKLTDPKYQIPVMYHMLQDYILYCRKNHIDVVDEAFLESVRDYKNHIRSRLVNDYS